MTLQSGQLYTGGLYSSLAPWQPPAMDGSTQLPVTAQVCRWDGEEDRYCSRTIERTPVLGWGGE